MHRRHAFSSTPELGKRDLAKERDSARALGYDLQGFKSVERFYKLTGEDIKEKTAARGPSSTTPSAQIVAALLGNNGRKKLPSKLTVAEAAALCEQVVERELERLPHTRHEERLSRLRLPRNRSDRLLREGVPTERVVLDAATRVLEQWIHILRRLVPHDSLEELLAETVHGSDRRGAFVNTPEFFGYGITSETTPKKIKIDPNPMPPITNPLGEALRRLVPNELEVGKKPWEFLEDLLDAATLEDRFEYASPVHSVRPDTAVRQHWSSAMKIESGFSQAPFLEAKNRTLQEGAGDRRCALSTTAKLRLSGWGSWATFNESGMSRRTCCAWSPQVFMSGQAAHDMPGPGQYEKPKSSCATRRRGGEYPRVGALRCVGSETLELRDRFMMPKPY